MLKPVFAVVIAAVLFFGGTGATVYAAQGSLPDQALYPIKTWSEDAQISLAGSPLLRLNYDLDFSDRRITEMAGLLSIGNPIPEMVVTRLQNELQQALELAAAMDDPQMLQQLEQIRLRAETQLRKMSVLMSGAPESVQPTLLQARTRIQQQVQLATLGKVDPQGFKMQVRQQLQYQDGSGSQTPQPENRQQGPAMQTPVGTPMPDGGGYGPGPGNGSQGPALQTPVGPSMPGGDGYGPGPGNGAQGSTPQAPAGTPVPPGNGNGSGMGGNQPTGMPGQNGAGTPAQECTPRNGGGSGNGP